MEIFRDGLLWALWLDDMAAAARRIAEYPGDDVPERDSDFGPADRAWLMLAASLVLETPMSDWHVHEQAISRARARKPRLLLAALRAISAGDAATLRKSILECVRHHIRTEFSAQTNALHDKLALDASLVCQLASRRGLTIDLPPKERDHIVDLSVA